MQAFGKATCCMLRLELQPKVRLCRPSGKATFCRLRLILQPE